MNVKDLMLATLTIGLIMIFFLSGWGLGLILLLAPQKVIKSSLRFHKMLGIEKSQLSIDPEGDFTIMAHKSLGILFIIVFSLPLCIIFYMLVF
jgi:hypothetical protein